MSSHNDDIYWCRISWSAARYLVGGVGCRQRWQMCYYHTQTTGSLSAAQIGQAGISCTGCVLYPAPVSSKSLLLYDFNCCITWHRRLFHLVRLYVRSFEWTLGFYRAVFRVELLMFFRRSITARIDDVMLWNLTLLLSEERRAGPSTEGGWRQTVSNLGQGESSPLAFPTWAGKINPRTFYQLTVALLCGICLLWQLTVTLPVLRD